MNLLNIFILIFPSQNVVYIIKKTISTKYAFSWWKSSFLYIWYEQMTLIFCWIIKDFHYNAKNSFHLHVQIIYTLNINDNLKSVYSCTSTIVIASNRNLIISNVNKSKCNWNHTLFDLQCVQFMLLLKLKHYICILINLRHLLNFNT